MLENEPENLLSSKRKFSRRDFLIFAGISAAVIASVTVENKVTKAVNTLNHFVYLPAINKASQGIFSSETNQLFYSGLKAMRAQGTEIVGDNTDQWGMYYTKPTNIGLDLISTAVAEKKSLISSDEAVSHIDGVLRLIQQLRTYEGIFPEFIKIEGGRIFAEEKNGRIRYSSLDSAWLTLALSIVRDNYQGSEASNLAKNLIVPQNYSIFLDANGLMGAGFEIDARTNIPLANSVILGSRPEAHMFHELVMNGEVVPTSTLMANFGFSYNNKNSEARSVILLLVSMGKLPEASWDNMFYHWVTKEGLLLAEGYNWSAFVELTNNIFYDEMFLTPNSFAKSHLNYVAASKNIAQRLGYSIYGWAPCTDPQGGYIEYGLDRNTVVSPYAAALLSTTDDIQSVANLQKVANIALNGQAPLPDTLSSSSGRILNSRALTLDQALFFLGVNKNTIRNIVSKTQWYNGAEVRMRKFDRNA